MKKTIILKDNSRIILSENESYILFTEEQKKGINVHLQILGYDFSFLLTTIYNKIHLEPTIDCINEYLTNNEMFEPLNMKDFYN